MNTITLYLMLIFLLVIGIIFVLVLFMLGRRKNTVKKLYQIALSEFENKNFEKAKKLLQKVTRRDPKNQEALHKLGLTLFHLKEYKKSKLAFEKISDTNPDYFIAIYNLALTYQMQKEYDNAKNLYTKAIEMNSEDVDSRYNLGLIYLEEKNYQEALTNFEKANSITPNVPKILYYITKCQDKLSGESNPITQEALAQSYLKLIQSQDLPAEYFITAASCVAKTGNIEETIKLLEIAMEKDPENAATYKLLALIDLIQHKNNEAKSNILIAIDLDPTDNEAYNILKYIEKQGQQTE